jgi:hypothetical protein
MKYVPIQKFKQGILHVLCEYVERYLELLRKSAGLQKKDPAQMHRGFTAERQQ